MAAAALEQLLDDPRIWRGRKADHAPNALPSGHATLDAALPGGGWPRHALSEILLPADGLGELQLLLPALAGLGDAQHKLALIDPPYLPFPAAWQARGVDPAHLAIIDSGGQDSRDSLWAAEQALRSGACAAVLLWPRRISPTQMKRLQVAAEAGHAQAFVYRDARHAGEASPAALRLQLHPEQHGLEVLKCRGGTPPGRLLTLPRGLQ